MTRMSFIPVALFLVIHGIATSTNCNGQSTAATEQPKYLPGDLYLPTSRVYALVGKTGLGHEHGVTGSIKSGRVLLGATENAGVLVFDMASFVADTDAARKAVGLEGGTSESTRKAVTDNMLGSYVLHAAKFPEATYQIESIVEDTTPHEGESRRFVFTGQFTLQKVTRPLTFVADVDVKNGWHRVRGSFRLKQSDFGIKPFTKAFGAIGVADEMTVMGELWVAPSAGMAKSRDAIVR